MTLILLAFCKAKSKELVINVCLIFYLQIWATLTHPFNINNFYLIDIFVQLFKHRIVTYKFRH